jgi:hypothetical protein
LRVASDSTCAVYDESAIGNKLLQGASVFEISLDQGDALFGQT